MDGCCCLALAAHVLKVGQVLHATGSRPSKASRKFCIAVIFAVLPRESEDEPIYAADSGRDSQPHELSTPHKDGVPQPLQGAVAKPRSRRAWPVNAMKNHPPKPMVFSDPMGILHDVSLRLGPDYPPWANPVSPLPPCNSKCWAGCLVRVDIWSDYQISYVVHGVYALRSILPENTFLTSSSARPPQLVLSLRTMLSSERRALFKHIQQNLNTSESARTLLPRRTAVIGLSIDRPCIFSSRSEHSR